MVQETKTYNTLADVQREKMQLNAEIMASRKSIGIIWNNLFHGNKQKTPASPAQRFTQLITTGSGVIDGILLGWKLYRRFKR